MSRQDGKNKELIERARETNVLNAGLPKCLPSVGETSALAIRGIADAFGARGTGEAGSSTVKN
jgi:hypothetical protein